MSLPILFRVNWYIRRPTSNLRSDYYVQPFAGNMWFVVFIATIIIGTICSMTSSVYENSNRNLTDDLFICFEILCNQNGNEKMKSVSLRILCLAISLVAIVVFSSYGAVITSFLTVETLDIPFTNIDGFLKNEKYKLFLIEEDFVQALQNMVNTAFLN